MTFGPGQIGSLKNGDGRELRVYVGGKQIQDPATYKIKKNDNIVIAFGTGKEQIDLNPDTTNLRKANSGASSCSIGGKDGKKQKGCLISEKGPAGE